ncbi:hypothetical protein LEMLEM_LOCUS7657 [Lemmus lemmus]
MPFFDIFRSLQYGLATDRGREQDTEKALRRCVLMMDQPALVKKKLSGWRTTLVNSYSSVITC